MKQKIFLLFIIALYSNSSLLAQENTFVEQDDVGVIRLMKEELSISKSKDGNFFAESKIVEEIELLGKHSMTLLSDKDIYHSYFHELTDVNAYTIKPNGKRKTEIPILKKETKSDKSENVFFEDGKITKITFGGLEQGVSTHIDYTLKHKDIHLLSLKLVYPYLPIQHFEYVVRVPKDMKLRFKQNEIYADFFKMDIKEEKNERVYTFTANEVKKFKSFENPPPFEYYAIYIIPIIESIKDNNGEKEILKSPKGLYKFYYSNILENEMAPDASIKEMAQKIVGDASTNLEKSKKIYAWVQEKIKYIAFEDGYGGFVPRRPNDICKKQYGDCKDMSTLLVNLHRALGINAYHTWIGTRDIPFSYQEVPTPVSDNHMICAVALKENDYTILDATNSKLPYGIIPSHLQGKEALIGLGPDDFIIKKLDIAKAEQNVAIDSTLLELEEDGKIIGTSKVELTGYRAWELITNLSYKDEKERKDYLMKFLYKGNNKFLLDTLWYEQTAWNTVVIHGKFNIENYIQKVDKDYYIEMLFNKIYKDYYINGTDRKVKVDNDYAETHKFVYTLKIPKGYKVAYKPKDISGGQKNHYAYEIKYEDLKDKLVVSQKIVYELMDIFPEHFSQHNQLVKELTEAYKESINLTKNEN